MSFKHLGNPNHYHQIQALGCRTLQGPNDLKAYNEEGLRYHPPAKF